MATRPLTFNRVYVWELPVRIYHWLNAACVVVLIVTGFLIGRPLSISYSNEAYQQYWFGTVRLVHFVAAFVFFFNFVFRIYWGFAGNHWARWNRFIPTGRQQFREIFHVLKVDILQVGAASKISIGHNALAGLTDFLSFLVFLSQALTGFALYSGMSEAWFPSLFAGIAPAMGGDFAVRHWHHVSMWFFVIFTLVHVYLVFYHDYVEGRGTTSSMVGGWKFEREHEVSSRKDDVSDSRHR